MAKKAQTEVAAVTPKNVFAYTEHAHGSHVPGYASLNKHADGSYWLTVRTSGGAETAGMCIPEDQLKQLAAAIAADLA
jgi:hypothetical protein